MALAHPSPSPYLRKPQPSLTDILAIRPKLKVIDLGANPLIGGRPPYFPLFAAGYADVIGFEPDPDAFAHLQANKGPREIYLPFAVGDGTTRTLYVCQAPGMTSLFPPDPQVLALFHGFPDWGRVTRTEEIKTVRLDDVPEADGAHYIKLDIQGAELMALQHATETLKRCLVVHAEVEFLPLYKDQPLFSELDAFMRSQGFMFHKFAKYDGRMLQPLVLENDIFKSLSQLVAAEAVFVRDLRAIGTMAADDLLGLAAIAHDCYGSWDLSFRLLLEHDGRFATSYVPTYIDALQQLLPLPSA